MNKIFLRTIGITGLLVTGPGSYLAGAEALPPPFGLQWGDTPSRLVDWAARTEMDQLVKTPSGEPSLKIFMFTPASGSLPDHEASTLEARFLDGRLFEVTLHYVYPGKPADFVRAKFAELKGILARRHGAFKPSGVSKEEPRDGIVTRSTAHRIDPSPNRFLVLALTEVMDAKRGDAAARFSVLYHNSSVLRGSGSPIVIRRDGVDLPEEPVDSSLSRSVPGDGEEK